MSAPFRVEVEDHVMLLGFKNPHKIAASSDHIRGTDDCLFSLILASIVAWNLTGNILPYKILK
jgi:hypothetical protein